MEEVQKEEEQEVGGGGLNPTEVRMSQIVMPSHSDHRQELSAGQLLKWMDSTACLSAERHAGCSCVTASIDDIYFDHTISVGQVVNIRAKVNRAFSTSMEVGIVVVCEDLYTDRRWRVCHAYATFVTQRSVSGAKVQLKPLPPSSQVEHSVAAERRRMRKLHDEIIKELLSDWSSQLGGGDVPAGGGGVPAGGGGVPAGGGGCGGVPAGGGGVPAGGGDGVPACGGGVPAGGGGGCGVPAGGGGGCGVPAGGGGVPAEKTRVESVELVLPPHANHQENTFGGQIMAWMVNVATIAASRLCQARPTLRSIDMFTFRGPSQVGDRLLLRSIVNNTFKTSMEVGVQAEAYRGGGPNRHINSAFMIFEVLDAHGSPRTLPRIRPEPLEGARRFQEAIARKKIRLDRKYIISCKQSEVPLSVPWNPSNQVYLSYNNVSALKMLAAQVGWRLNSEKDQVCLYTLEQGGCLSFRVEAELEVSAQRAFSLLGELRNRVQWDCHYLECDLIRSADKDDFLYRVVTPSVSHAPGGSPNQEAGVLQDFILLASRRRPCGPGDPYVVALRSVSLPTHPPSPPSHRGEVLCAGFTILETQENTCLVSYYNQASPEVLPYISTDIAGLSSSFYRHFCSCRHYLTQNCLGAGDLDQDQDQDQDLDFSSLDSVTLF